MQFGNTPIMSDGLFHPMAPADSVPGIIRHYHYQHVPPPSNPTEFMVALRRGLRGANKVGLWGKLRAVRFDNHTTPFEVPLLRPDFPVAPPGTPRVPTPLPDVYITPASPSCELNPLPLPQEEGFLAVPTRTSRVRNSDISSPPTRPLPTPPDHPPPPYPIPGVDCCWCMNGASRPPTNEPLTTPDLSTEDIVVALLYADSVDTPDDGSLSPNHGGTPVGSQQRGSPGIVSVMASSDSASEPRDSPFTLNDTLLEGIRDVATDAEFLDELGLSARDYMQLLDGVDLVQLDDKEEGRD